MDEHLDEKPVYAKDVKIENLRQTGDIHTEQGFTVGKFYIVHGLRTPWQLFKASVAITAGVLLTVGLVIFASRSLEYIKTFF